MRCDDIRDVLIEYLGGELSERESDEVRLHVATCDACRRELESLQDTFAMLADDGYREPSPFYWTRFQARLRRRMERDGLRSTPRARWVPRFATATVAVACFAIGLWVGFHPGDGAPTQDIVRRGRSVDMVAGGPVISPRSKLLVQTGAIPDAVGETAAFAPDTLAPDSFGPLGENPQMMLTTSRPHSGAQPGLGRRLMTE
jgi:anti-sigma factor RsiW